MCKSGKQILLPRQRNNCCPQIRGDSWPSFPHCIKSPRQDSGAFRPKKRGLPANAYTSPMLFDIGSESDIEAAHQFLGHAGITATAHFCRKRVYMFRLVPEVHRVLQQCHSCQVKSQKSPTQHDVHRPSIQAGAPFQVWSMDVLGPLRASSEGHRYLLTLKDVFSKWF